MLGRDFGRRVEVAARPAYEAFLADGGSGASPDTSVQRLLSPLEALVDQAAKTVDAVLAGRLGLAEAGAEGQGWDATAALRRVLEVVFGPGRCHRHAVR
ncbi:hypothetical protein ACOZFM_28640 [Streptomyces arboris]|uniref:hypothetical protein n=1 Tax=Streptomyces arboris TaxID=2600619 RepID=UPI003BF5827C